MNFEGDARKARSNLEKHGLSFEAGTVVFADRAVVVRATARAEDGEAREKAVGEIAGRLFCVFFHRRGEALGSSPPAVPTRPRSAPMATVRFELDPQSPPRLSPERRARLDALTDAEITAAALDDPDNPPMSEEEAELFRVSRLVRLALMGAGLSLAALARTVRIDPARLAGWERGTARPDPMERAYLTVIAADPAAVLRALGPRAA